MTPHEFNKIIVALKAYYQKENIFTDDHTIELWYRSLKDIPYQTLGVAVQKWAETEKWSPTIADLRRLSFEVSNPEILSWDAAWETVMEAVRRYGYNRRVEAMDSFDEITRKAVSRIGFIQICRSEEIGIERAAFRDIYKMLADKTVEEGQIAPAIRKVIESTRQAHLRTAEARQMIEEKKDEYPAETKPSVNNDAPINNMSEKTRELLRKTKESLRR